MKYLNIVVAGDIASGKTTLAKALAQKLQWNYLSAGDYFRKYHLEHHIPLYDKLAIPEDIEKDFDKSFKENIAVTPNIVFEGHYQGWNARSLTTSFRVLVVTDMHTAFERALARNHTHEESFNDLIKRKDALRQAFKKLYGDINYLDKKYFDIVIDNTVNTPEETLKIAFDAFNKANQS